MNSTLKPAWSARPSTLATISGALVLPLVAVVAINVADIPFSNPPERSVVQHQAMNPSSNDAETSVQPGLAEVKESLLNSTAETRQGIAASSSERTATRGKALRLAPRTQSSGGMLSLSSKGAGIRALDSIRPLPVPIVQDRERYPQFADNGVTAVATSPVSTFSIDVDTASYARVRAMLNSGNLPPKDMVRVEEMINYFDYSYPLPASRSQPFKPTVSIMPTPWNEHTHLMHIGIKGFDIVQQTQPKANLVFLLDVSGSMNQPDKLPLLIKSFRLLLQKLNPEDTVSIVTYAGRSATVLDSTQASDRSAIIGALDNLKAGGSTAGAQGIEQAYRLAEKNFVKDGVNRVMLATDGDFNVGMSDPGQLKDFIANKRKKGIYLSVFGFGQGNYNDTLMQTLAQNGNGQAVYIDTLAEAQKSLVEESGGTVFPIATDVKIQVEFDPSKVSEYRLIGYETRALKRQDFNNDKVDAGDIGAGHAVTAIYELTPVGSPAVLNSPLRYGDAKVVKPTEFDGELAYLKMRYKLPGQSKSILLEQPVTVDQSPRKSGALSEDAGFAVAVSAFGQKLRGNPALQDYSYAQIAKMALANRGEDRFGYRSAFVQLVRMAGSLTK